MAPVPVAADRDYPLMIAEINHVEPALRRVRAMLGGEQVFGAGAINGVAGTARFDWAALDAWYEEEQVFVHPRNPYARVDALRSHRSTASGCRRPEPTSSNDHHDRNAAGKLAQVAEAICASFCSVRHARAG